MRTALRPLAILLPLLAVVPAAAQDRDNPMPAVHADHWAEAAAQAATYADPVAAKLVQYYRMLAPGAATPAEIAAFMHANPDWPAQGLLERRWEAALTTDTDDHEVLQQCTARQPAEAPALLRCAEALAGAGHHKKAQADARRAWITGLPSKASIAAFLQRWGKVPTQADQWARFRHLAWHDASAAEHQLVRLDPADRAAGEARLALLRQAPHAERLLLKVPASLRDDPALVLDHARYLRRADRETEAVALWKEVDTTAQAAAPAHRRSFWLERSILARKLLQQGDAADAYALVAAHGPQSPAVMAEAEFLAGFIALRKLHDPAAATQHFQVLASMHAAITQGRAQYWLGRAAAAAGKDPKPHYAKAAAWPTTFYGQLAALAMGESQSALARRIDALRDPGWNRQTVRAFTGHEVVRAAAWLVAWGVPRRARPFLLRMDALAPDPAERVLTAEFALKVGLPDIAVFVARRMGVEGTLLPQDGWPMPFDPPASTLDPAVALGIMRQESSFDVGAVSPSGARGLMQLMPPTAAEVAKQLGVHTSLVSLTADPAHNMRLGTRYLQEMLTRFDESLPLAAAAYNAGPHRVDQWLAENGDPRTGAVDMLDWLEEIPSGQTRNYVQRVLENVVIYRARLGESTPTLKVRWAR